MSLLWSSASIFTSLSIYIKPLRAIDLFLQFFNNSKSKILQPFTQTNY